MGNMWPQERSPRPARRSIVALAPVLAIAGAFFLSTALTLPPAEANAAISAPNVALAMDAELCPRDAAAMRHRAAYLVDLRKPLGEERQSLPGDLFDRLAAGLDKGDELAVFAVSEYALAPRVPLGRLCKPYAAADVVGDTKTRLAAGESECGKLPAQMPHALRETATAFCDQRDRLRQRVDDLAARATTPSTHAHLVEAIEETVAAFPANAPATTLHVFSDMFQETDWYSHAQTDSRRWEFADFAADREQAAAPLPAEPNTLATAVEIFYLRRRGSTGRTEARERHQAFWTDYFATHALRPTFHDPVL